MPRKRDPMPPEEATDEAIAEFWDTHDIADYWDELEIADDVKFAKPKKEVVSIRLEPIYRQQLNALARKMGVGHSILIRHWVIEKLHPKIQKAGHHTTIKP